MTIVSSQLVEVVSVPNSKRVQLTLQAIDNTSKVWTQYQNVSATSIYNDALVSWVSQLELDLLVYEVDEETQRAKVGDRQAAQHQPQADLDRAVLNTLMQIEDSVEFLSTKSWFDDFESRIGPNATARANHLGVPKAEYDLVASRYSQIETVTVGVLADASQVWSAGVWS